MIVWLILACAVKDGADVLRIQKSYHEHVQNTPASKLSFEQSMAKLYMQKSWEEYSNAHYQDALNLAAKSEEWLQKSIKKEKEASGEQNAQKEDSESTPSDQNTEIKPVELDQPDAPKDTQQDTSK